MLYEVITIALVHDEDTVTRALTRLRRCLDHPDG